MGSFGKSITLLLILIVGISWLGLLTAKPANAQSVAKLSVPEFTVTYTDHPYDVPASTTIDPFTGTTVQNPSYHVENRSLTFTIKNQTVTQGQLHYIIRLKGHFAENWTGRYDGLANKDSFLTVWTFSSSNEEGREEGRLYYRGDSISLPYVGQVDFQIKAQTWGEVMATRSPQNIFGGSITTLFRESDWGNTQTITLTNGSFSASTSPNSTSTSLPNYGPTSSPTPAVPELSWLAIVPLLLSLFFVAVVIRHRKTANSKKVAN
jgi:hypothetical protein